MIRLWPLLLVLLAFGCCSSTASEPPQAPTVVYVDRIVEVKTGCPCGCALGAECTCNKVVVPAPVVNGPCGAGCLCGCVESGECKCIALKAAAKEKANRRPTLAIFGAKWCAPCRSMDKIIDRISDDFEVTYIDIDERPDVAKKYGVTSIPRILIYRGADGLVWDRTGVQTEEAIRAAMSGTAPAVATSSQPVATSGGCASCGTSQRTTAFRRR